MSRSSLRWKYEYFNFKQKGKWDEWEAIERIIHHVNTEWGIKVVLKDTKVQKARKQKEPWAGKLNEQWDLPLSKLNK